MSTSGECRRQALDTTAVQQAVVVLVVEVVVLLISARMALLCQTALSSLVVAVEPL